MSQVYHTEPPTNGKVILRTSHGDIDIELWSKEAPLACRNFIQLALEGYYDRTIVNRIVKGFMVQMGDPTGTGTGGESIWGKPFKDEIHGRIKFNHRGQVSMANSNKPHSNQSQFFITLDSCDWLNGKHTIFGKVTGNTIFNVLRIGEEEVNKEELPVRPIRVNTVEVVWNPFDDIIPRNILHHPQLVVAESNVKDNHGKIKATKNANLLSFASEENDDEEESADQILVRFKSVHDTKRKTAKPREEHSSLPVRISVNPKNDDREDGEDFDKRMRGEILEKLRSDDNKLGGKGATDNKQILSRAKGCSARFLRETEDIEDSLLNPETIVKAVEAETKQQLINQKNEEFKRLKDELLGNSRAVKVLTGAEAEEKRRNEAFNELATATESRRLKHLKRKQEYGDRSEDTLKKLMKFTESLRSKKSSHNGDVKVNEGPESYHGQILEADENAKDDLDDWFIGKLKCKKHIDEQYRS